jgi:hypothetical protein
MTAYQKAKDLLLGRGLAMKNKIKEKTHITTRETTLHKERPNLTRQHSMVATQHGSSTTW